MPSCHYPRFSSRFLTPLGGKDSTHLPDRETEAQTSNLWNKLMAMVTGTRYAIPAACINAPDRLPPSLLLQHLVYSLRMMTESCFRPRLSYEWLAHSSCLSLCRSTLALCEPGLSRWLTESLTAGKHLGEEQKCSPFLSFPRSHQIHQRRKHQ